MTSARIVRATAVFGGVAALAIVLGVGAASHDPQTSGELVGMLDQARESTPAALRRQARGPWTEVSGRALISCATEEAAGKVQRLFDKGYTVRELAEQGIRRLLPACDAERLVSGERFRSVGSMEVGVQKVEMVELGKADFPFTSFWIPAHEIFFP